MYKQLYNSVKKMNKPYLISASCALMMSSLTVLQFSPLFPFWILQVEGFLRLVGALKFFFPVTGLGCKTHNNSLFRRIDLKATMADLNKIQTMVGKQNIPLK